MTILTVLALCTSVTVAATETYQVDSTKSQATIHVGKAGAFSFIAGHTHEVSAPVESGAIDLDPDAPSRARVHLTIATSALHVVAEREPEGDAPMVQAAMEGEKVLDVAHHPRISYESSSIAVKQRNGNRLDLTVTGRLTIREVTREVTAPVRVEISGSTLSGTGKFTIKQSAFGIKPISVGGVVAVKDALDIDFAVFAHK
jgi:polyisoprenoid-binding protein YceI